MPIDNFEKKKSLRHLGVHRKELEWPFNLLQGLQIHEACGLNCHFFQNVYIISHYYQQLSEF